MPPTSWPRDSLEMSETPPLSLWNNSRSTTCKIHLLQTSENVTLTRVKDRAWCFPHQTRQLLWWLYQAQHGPLQEVHRLFHRRKVDLLPRLHHLPLGPSSLHPWLIIFVSRSSSKNFVGQTSRLSGQEPHLLLDRQAALCRFWRGRSRLLHLRLPLMGWDSFILYILLSITFIPPTWSASYDLTWIILYKIMMMKGLPVPAAESVFLYERIPANFTRPFLPVTMIAVSRLTTTL